MTRNIFNNPALMGAALVGIWELPKTRGTSFWGPYNKDPTI